ncbi:hypothetical protein EV385_6576 [Krasilnikovia cinnamomea]|uniref:Cholesterol esterase n=1 Tax=Krasilnikovia cinnamomea TaxID=349313 RepID=A0A4Q7ZVI9_9ACTN|nr:DUF6230 family protein [Krasilnikovia cinnamomea]RZU54625.1 hypothetical protein EV385_6576 [Krasilnikovia cinnamomea]
MKDEQGEPAYGGTNWRRFAVAVGVPTLVAGGIVLGIANGALAATFSVSGQSFKISADKLEGDGFAQYGGKLHPEKGSDIPVALSGINKAKLTNLCQSVKTPGLPISLTIRAGREDGKPAEASELLIGLTELSGDANFKNINIGQSAATLTKGGPDAHDGTEAGKNGFGQEADSVVITNLRQIGYSATAATFNLKGLSLKLNVDTQTGKPPECF